MSAPEQDDWDECADCGHDRDQHSDRDCIGSPNCRCSGFLDERAI